MIKVAMRHAEKPSTSLQHRVIRPYIKTVSRLRTLACGWYVCPLLLLIVAAVGADVRPPRTVRLAVIAPSDPSNEQSLQRVLPSVQLAVRKVAHPITGTLPGWDIRIEHRDSQCSSTHGPLAAFEFYINRTADAFLGPVCDYVIAPVARYAGVWGIPVLTAGAQADAFRHKPLSYPTLTRMMGSYSLVGEALREILHVFGWQVAALLYHNHPPSSSIGHSVCHFTLGAVYTALNSTPTHKSFNENVVTRDDYKQMLLSISKTARIVVVCANPLTVREILLAAEELNMVGSGEYVFFNIELFNSMTEDSLQPWHVKNDTDERNERAKKAYSALLTVTAATPNNTLYRAFSEEVKQLARDKYNYEFGNETVSTFVTAFYDAVILYSLALRQTIDEGGSELDGALITKNMWNRTFKGITGNVTIDANGDRTADYSLLDMDKDTFVFRTVANYIGATKTLEDVPNMVIYWAGGRDNPPSDTPVCGYDRSLCPDNTLTATAILSIVLSSVVVLLAIASYFIFRTTCSGVEGDPQEETLPESIPLKPIMEDVKNERGNLETEQDINCMDNIFLENNQVEVDVIETESDRSNLLRA